MSVDLSKYKPSSVDAINKPDTNMKMLIIALIFFVCTWGAAYYGTAQARDSLALENELYDKFYDAGEFWYIEFDDDRDEALISYGNSDVYEGDMKSGTRHGLGTLHFENGNWYVGEFHQGVIEGAGTLYLSEDEYYEGTWDDNFLNGEGRYMKVNDYEYIGEFENDMLSGRGVLTFDNGEYYEGDFKENRYHGDGIYYDRYGNIKYDVVWEKGDPVNGEE